MISQSNLPFGQFTRLDNDETATLDFLLTVDGQDDNLTGRLFALDFCTYDSMTPVLRLTDADFTRPATNHLQLKLKPLKAQLPDTKYTLYLHELKNTEREPIAFFSYERLVKPAKPLPNAALEPAYMQLDYTTATGNYVVITAYLVRGIAYVEADTYGLMQLLPVAGPCLIGVANDERWDETGTLYFRKGGLTRRLATIA